MTTQVTQCPSCGTLFRYTDAQLALAHGAVRCGSCLHIFQARDHQTTEEDTNNEQFVADDTPATEAPETDTQFLTKADDPHQILAATDDQQAEESEALFTDIAGQDILDTIFDENIFDDDIFADDTSLDSLADELLATHRGQHTLSPEAEAAIDFNNNPATAWDENYLDDARFSDDSPLLPLDHDEAEEEIDAAATINFSDSFLKLDSDDDEANTAFSEQHNSASQRLDNDDVWADKLLEEEMDAGDLYQPPASLFDQLNEPDQSDPEGDLYQPPASLFDQLNEPDQSDPEGDLYQPPASLFDQLNEPDQDDQLDPELQDLLTLRDKDYDQNSLEQPPFADNTESLVAGDRIGNDRQTLLANIAPEPVEFSPATPSSPRTNRLWAVAAVAALTLLFFQYVLANFDSLARDERYRPLLVTGCTLFKCTLPERDNVSLIQSSNLLVRSHPDIQQALIVDAILVNRANFKQPFPVMELRFTDLAGGIIGGRYFSPEDYLAGELSGRRVMPIRQPIRVSLEIVDPGEQAVNYELHFHSSKGRRSLVKTSSALSSRD